MTAVAAAAGDSLAGTTGPPSRLDDRVAASAGLAFVTLAVLQNALRAGLLPAFDATPAQVSDSFGRHAWAVRILLGLFVVAGVGLAVFIGGLWSRVGRGAARGWAQAGLVGAIGTFAIFPIVVSCEVALLVLVGGPAPEPGAVETLWALHNALFVVNSLALSVAVLGLAVAAATAGIVARRVATIGSLGAALLIVSAISAPQIAGGDQPLFAVMGLGYVSWLALVTVSALGLLRNR